MTDVPNTLHNVTEMAVASSNRSWHQKSSRIEQMIPSEMESPVSWNMIYQKISEFESETQTRIMRRIYVHSSAGIQF